MRYTIANLTRLSLSIYHQPLLFLPLKLVQPTSIILGISVLPIFFFHFHRFHHAGVDEGENKKKNWRKYKKNKREEGGERKKRKYSSSLSLSTFFLGFRVKIPARLAFRCTSYHQQFYPPFLFFYFFWYLFFLVFYFLPSMPPFLLTPLSFSLKTMRLSFVGKLISNATLASETDS